MLLKRQLMRMMVVGGLAVMGTGVSQAGGCGPCCWCGSPAPKASSQAVATPLSAFSPVVSILLSLI